MNHEMIMMRYVLGAQHPLGGTILTTALFGIQLVYLCSCVRHLAFSIGVFLIFIPFKVAWRVATYVATHQPFGLYVWHAFQSSNTTKYQLPVSCNSVVFIGPNGALFAADAVAATRHPYQTSAASESIQCTAWDFAV